jgi:hypothetical protein
VDSVLVINADLGPLHRVSRRWSGADAELAGFAT